MHGVCTWRVGNGTGDYTMHGCYIAYGMYPHFTARLINLKHVYVYRDQSNRKYIMRVRSY